MAFRRAELRLGLPTYEAYLRGFADAVDPSLISFDVYPLLSREDDAPGLRPQPLAEDEETLSREFFDNWRMIREQALRSGVPSWVFIQSIAYDLTDLLCPCRARRTPTEAEIRWQANVGLAYGAQGIQYFTYWSPASNPETTFGAGLLTREGERTPLYAAAQRVNADLQALGRALRPLASESVMHAGEQPLPPGARRWHPDGWTTRIGGDPVVVGRFRAPSSRESHRSMMVVNRSSQAAATTTLRLPPPVKLADALTPGGTAVTQRRAPNGTKVQLTLPAGGAALLELERHRGR